MNGHKSLKLKALLLLQDRGETWLLLRQYYLTYLNSGQFLDVINMTPADKFYGRDKMILERKEKVRRKSMKMRRELYRVATMESLPNGTS